MPVLDKYQRMISQWIEFERKFELTKDEIYSVYLPPGLETTSINMGDSGKEFLISWYNPRKGGDMVSGSLESVHANGVTSLMINS